jgi:hypothetical protein
MCIHIAVFFPMCPGCRKLRLRRHSRLPQPLLFPQQPFYDIAEAHVWTSVLSVRFSPSRARPGLLPRLDGILGNYSVPEANGLEDPPLGARAVARSEAMTEIRILVIFDGCP